MKEFLTIGELADIFNMDVQLLRHYDAKGLLVPQVRNSANNRHFYHFDQVYPLATIRYLRRLDYSLAQIKAFLHSNGLRDNLQMLSPAGAAAAPSMRRAECHHPDHPAEGGVYRAGAGRQPTG